MNSSEASNINFNQLQYSNFPDSYYCNDLHLTDSSAKEGALLEGGEEEMNNGEMDEAELDQFIRENATTFKEVFTSDHFLQNEMQKLLSHEAKSFITSRDYENASNKLKILKQYDESLFNEGIELLSLELSKHLQEIVTLTTNITTFKKNVADVKIESWEDLDPKLVDLAECFSTLKYRTREFNSEIFYEKYPNSPFFFFRHLSSLFEQKKFLLIESQAKHFISNIDKNKPSFFKKLRIECFFRIYRLMIFSKINLVKTEENKLEKLFEIKKDFENLLVDFPNSSILHSEYVEFLAIHFENEFFFEALVKACHQTSNFGLYFYNFIETLYKKNKFHLITYIFDHIIYLKDIIGSVHIYKADYFHLISRKALGQSDFFLKFEKEEAPKDILECIFQISYWKFRKNYIKMLELLDSFEHSDKFPLSNSIRMEAHLYLGSHNSAFEDCDIDQINPNDFDFEVYATIALKNGTFDKAFQIKVINNLFPKSFIYILLKQLYEFTISKKTATKKNLNSLSSALKKHSFHPLTKLAFLFSLNNCKTFADFLTTKDFNIAKSLVLDDDSNTAYHLTFAKCFYSSPEKMLKILDMSFHKGSNLRHLVSEGLPFFAELDEKNSHYLLKTILLKLFLLGKFFDIEESKLSTELKKLEPTINYICKSNLSSTLNFIQKASPSKDPYFFYKKEANTWARERYLLTILNIAHSFLIRGAYEEGLSSLPDNYLFEYLVKDNPDHLKIRENFIALKSTFKSYFVKSFDIALNHFNSQNYLLSLRSLPNFYYLVGLEEIALSILKLKIKCYINTNEVDKVISETLNAFRVAPKDCELHLFIAQAYYIKKEFEKALHHFNKYFSLGGKEADANVFYQRALSATIVNKIEPYVFEALITALIQNPYRFSSLELLSKILNSYYGKNIEKATLFFQTLPNSFISYYAQANYFYENGFYKESFAASLEFEKIINLKPPPYLCFLISELSFKASHKLSLGKPLPEIRKIENIVPPKWFDLLLLLQESLYLEDPTLINDAVSRLQFFYKFFEKDPFYKNYIEISLAKASFYLNGPAIAKQHLVTVYNANWNLSFLTIVNFLTNDYRLASQTISTLDKSNEGFTLLKIFEELKNAKSISEKKALSLQHHKLLKEDAPLEYFYSYIIFLIRAGLADEIESLFLNFPKLQGQKAQGYLYCLWAMGFKNKSPQKTLDILFKGLEICKNKTLIFKTCCSLLAEFIKIYGPSPTWLHYQNKLYAKHEGFPEEGFFAFHARNFLVGSFFFNPFISKQPLQTPIPNRDSNLMQAPISAKRKADVLVSPIVVENIPIRAPGLDDIIKDILEPALKKRSISEESSFDQSALEIIEAELRKDIPVQPVLENPSIYPETFQDILASPRSLQPAREESSFDQSALEIIEAELRKDIPVQPVLENPSIYPEAFQDTLASPRSLQPAREESSFDKSALEIIEAELRKDIPVQPVLIETEAPSRLSARVRQETDYDFMSFEALFDAIDETNSVTFKNIFERNYKLEEYLKAKKGNLPFIFISNERQENDILLEYLLISHKPIIYINSGSKNKDFSKLLINKKRELFNALFSRIETALKRGFIRNHKERMQRLGLAIGLALKAETKTKDLNEKNFFEELKLMLRNLFSLDQTHKINCLRGYKSFEELLQNRNIKRKTKNPLFSFLILPLDRLVSNSIVKQAKIYILPASFELNANDYSKFSAIFNPKNSFFKTKLQGEAPRFITYCHKFNSHSLLEIMLKRSFFSFVNRDLQEKCLISLTSLTKNGLDALNNLSQEGSSSFQVILQQFFTRLQFLKKIEGTLFAPYPIDSFIGLFLSLDKSEIKIKEASSLFKLFLLELTQDEKLISQALELFEVNQETHEKIETLFKPKSMNLLSERSPLPIEVTNNLSSEIKTSSEPSLKRAFTETFFQDLEKSWERLYESQSFDENFEPPFASWGLSDPQFVCHDGSENEKKLINLKIMFSRTAEYHHLAMDNPLSIEELQELEISCRQQRKEIIDLSLIVLAELVKKNHAAIRIENSLNPDFKEKIYYLLNQTLLYMKEHEEDFSEENEGFLKATTTKIKNIMRFFYSIFPSYLAGSFEPSNIKFLFSKKFYLIIMKVLKKEVDNHLKNYEIIKNSMQNNDESLKTSQNYTLGTIRELQFFIHCVKNVLSPSQAEEKNLSRYDIFLSKKLNQLYLY